MPSTIAFDDGDALAPSGNDPALWSDPLRAERAIDEPVPFATFGPRGGLAWTLARRLDGSARLTLAGSFEHAGEGLPLACAAGCRFVLIDFVPFSERSTFDPWAALASMKSLSVRMKSRRACPIAVDLHAERSTVLRAVELGAQGFVSPVGIGTHRLAALLTEAAAQGACLCPVASRHLVERVRAMEGASRPVDTTRAARTENAQSATLSTREIEILSLGARGLAVKRLARQLGLSPHTVTAHLKNMYRKLEAKNRSEAVYRAKALGLI